MKIFKNLFSKGYLQYTENTVDELDLLSLDDDYIITEIAHIVKWLKIKHGLWIIVTCHTKTLGNKKPMYMYEIRHYGEQAVEDDATFNTSEKAYAAAIIYILNNYL
jgi:hypothetical protein